MPCVRFERRWRPCPCSRGKQDFDDVTRRLKALLATLTPKVLELREADEWQRWANVAVQERLCAQMEALRALDDPEAIAREVRELQQQWRQAADVPRAQTDQLWRRFKTAHDEAWGRAEAHFAAEAETRAQNLAQKIVLCDKAEALAGSTSWIQTAEEIKTDAGRMEDDRPRVARAREGGLGPLPRGLRSLLHAAPGGSRRAQGDVGREPREEGGALVRAEALVESTDWEQTSAELRRLQAEWKTDRPGEEEPVRGDLAALPGSVRSLLHALRTPPRHRARRAGRGPRSDLCGARSAGVTRTPGAARRSRSSRCGASRPHAAGDRRARRGSRTGASDRGALDGRVRSGARSLARRVQRHRPRSRGEPQADGIARTTRGGSGHCCRRSGGRRRGRRGVVADYSPGGDAQGSARGQYDRRKGRR